MTAQELLSALEGDARARLRWLVLTRFGLAPGSAAARELTEADCLLSAAHMALDLRAAQGALPRNPQFDEARFAALRKGAG